MPNGEDKRSDVACHKETESMDHDGGNGQKKLFLKAADCKRMMDAYEMWCW